MNFQKIKLNGGAIVTVNLSEPAKCRECKVEIFWAVTQNLKNMPICRDVSGQWISHFTNCPGAKKFSKLEPGCGDTLDQLNRQRKRDNIYQQGD